MERSEQIGELIAALSKAQSEFGAATKDSDNPYYGSKYADLAAVIGAVRPALSKNGIAMVQFNESDLERQTGSVTTALLCGEQFISINAEAPATGKGKDGLPKFDVQTLGACWSYLRRYTLQAICGLASEDDDGNSLQGANAPIQRRTTPAPRPVQTLDPKPEPKQEGVFFENKELDLLNCVILGVTEKETKGKKPYAAVNFNGRIDGFNWASNWHTSLTPALKDAIGKTVTIKLSRKKSEDGRSVQFLNIEGILEIDGVEFVKPTVTEELEHA